MRHFRTGTGSAVSCCVVGIVLHLYEVLHPVIDQDRQAVDGEEVLFLCGLFLWSCLPYLACAAVAMVKKTPVLALGGALRMLTFDLYMYYSVFIRPVSSTAALGLLFAPLWNLLVFGPLGATILWAGVLIYRKFNRG